MTTEAQALLDRAEDSLRVAEFILASGEPGFAASRAYYAMFYCAEALLLSLRSLLLQPLSDFGGLWTTLCKDG